MAYQHKCQTCSHKIREGEAETQIQLSPPLYVHASWEGCQAAEASADRLSHSRSRESHGPSRRHRTLNEIEKQPDTPWEHR